MQCPLLQSITDLLLRTSDNRKFSVRAAGISGRDEAWSLDDDAFKPVNPLHYSKEENIDQR